MRAISFRGMDINGKWHYGLLAESAGFPKQPEVGVYISNTAGFPWAFQVRIETVGLCTGLRDNKGKWIYEGDILDDLEERPLTVRFSDIHASFELHNNDESFLFYEIHWDGMEVTGNIYENQELFKSR